MKPKARPYNDKTPCIAWICSGNKEGRFHCQFGESWWEACKQWHETDPLDVAPKADGDDWDDIPF